MWKGLLDRATASVVRTGDLTITYPDGSMTRRGNGNGPSVAILIKDWSTVRKLVLDAELALGEGYMDGRITIEGDDLYGLLTIAIMNADNGAVGLQRIQDRLRLLRRRLDQFNPAHRARQNVSHHYDLSAGLYDLFLDKDKQYSCAYFRTPEDTLEQAQAQKKAHIAGKLLIEPGMRVLDIGCGWGGMALTLARDFGARVTGVTLSKEQLKIAQARAEQAGLAEQIEFRLTDYRDVRERFDRIVSVGMFEHVGVPHYREYFGFVNDHLAEDGIALIHTIGRRTEPGVTSPWITKYIFPGGYSPSLSETMEAVETSGLWTADVEVWRLHYAETLKHWHDRFVANEERARELYDERFCRMWRYYLIASELTFRLHRQVVFQLQLSRKVDAVPLTRDYLYAPEPAAARHAAE